MHHARPGTGGAQQRQKQPDEHRCHVRGPGAGGHLADLLTGTSWINGPPHPNRLAEDDTRAPSLPLLRTVAGGMPERDLGGFPLSARPRSGRLWRRGAYAAERGTASKAASEVESTRIGVRRVVA